MDSSVAIVLFSGFLAGAVHVWIGPDHLAAVAPLSTDSHRKGWAAGLWWGIGHTGSVWLIGVIVFLSREALPLAEISQFSERLVGVVLIGLGIWGIRKALKTHIHYHSHMHNGIRHAHIHVHNQHSAHQPENHRAHRHSHAPVSIGILHGLAGSSHFWGILPALALPTQGSAVVYILGFGIGSILAISAFSWVIGKLMQHLLRWSANAFQRLQITFSTMAIGVGVMWLLVT